MMTMLVMVIMAMNQYAHTNVIDTPARDGLVVWREALSLCDSGAIPGGACHFQCVNDIDVSDTSLCRPFPPYLYRVATNLHYMANYGPQWG